MNRTSTTTMQLRGSCWKAGNLESFRTSSLMWKSIFFFCVKCNLANLPARVMYVYVYVYAANTQRVIKPELTPSILHLAAFQIGTILAVLKNSPLCLHYTAFAFCPVLPWLPPILIHVSKTVHKENEPQVKALHFRKCVGLESMWEWLPLWKSSMFVFSMQLTAL